MTRSISALLIATAAIVVALAGSGLARAPQAQSQAAIIGTANLAGCVVDQNGGAPIAGVRVLLQRSGIGGSQRGTYTDSTGAYAFPQIPPGTYEISASSPGWLSARYGQKKPDRSGTPIVVGDRETLKDLTIRMFRGGVITGQVRGQNSQPLVGVVVQALRMRYSADGRFLDLIGNVNTDDRGQYRIFGLTPGEYIVRAVPIASVTSDIALDGVQPGPAEGYARTFFPAWPSAGQAVPLLVAAAEERLGVDFALPLVPLVHVRGRLVGPNGPVTGAEFTRLDDDGLLRAGDPIASATGPNGQFVLTNIPAGMLTLLVGASPSPASAGTLWGTARMAVGDRDVSNVMITMQPGATVSGEIRFDGKSAPWDFTAHEHEQVVIRPAGSTPLLPGPTLAGVVDRGGRFSIGGVPPGAYHLTLFFGAGFAGSPWSLGSVMHDGRDFSSVALEVSTADMTGVVVTLTDRPSSLSGTIRAPTNVVVADYTVVAFPADAASRSARTRAVYAARPSTAGRFTMPRVFPGDYLLAVTDDIEPNAWFDPRVLERLAIRAVPVTIATGQAKVQDLQIGTGK